MNEMLAPRKNKKGQKTIAIRVEIGVYDYLKVISKVLSQDAKRKISITATVDHIAGVYRMLEVEEDKIFMVGDNPFKEADVARGEAVHQAVKSGTRRIEVKEYVLISKEEKTF